MSQSKANTSIDEILQGAFNIIEIAPHEQLGDAVVRKLKPQFEALISQQVTKGKLEELQVIEGVRFALGVKAFADQENEVTAGEVVKKFGYKTSALLDKRIAELQQQLKEG